jgi:CxxC motif-containing protein (DUF1111 family)
MRLNHLLLPVLSAAIGCGAEAPPTATAEAELRRIRPGDPFPGLGPVERALFTEGHRRFTSDLAIGEGLGPVYIERSCLSCHGLGGVGGADPGTDPNHFVQRFATLNADGSYNNLAALGGDVLQTRTIAGRAPSCSVPAEVIPPEATLHAVRNPQPMFGIGLIAAIPDATILANAVDRGDGIHGRPNLAPNGRPGRFGWKAQTEDLALFNAIAANGTMGLTSPLSAAEQRPQGQPLPAGCTEADLGVASPNDSGGAIIQAITAWEVLLAPVATRPIQGAAARGQALFTEIGCAKCHLPEMATGAFELTLSDGSRLPIPAVSNTTAALYSDLLLHDMGPDLDEGVVMRQARGSEFRTAPLWGLSLRERFLHDGRATSIHQAIAAHGGEAAVVRDRYLALPRHDRRAIRKFLRRI